MGRKSPLETQRKRALIRLPGSPERIVPVGPEAASVMEVIDLFHANFGCDPGPGDPLFFDLSSDVARRISDEQLAGLDFILKMLVEAGLPPEHLYAVKKTGRMSPATTCNTDSRRHRRVECGRGRVPNPHNANALETPLAGPAVQSGSSP
jgi:hypothetical protein